MFAPSWQPRYKPRHFSPQSLIPRHTFPVSSICHILKNIWLSNVSVHQSVRVQSSEFEELSTVDASLKAQEQIGSAEKFPQTKVSYRAPAGYFCPRNFFLKLDWIVLQSIGVGCAKHEICQFLLLLLSNTLCELSSCTYL